MSKRQNPLRIDYDGKWKILIEKAPKQFIEFFLPEIVAQIDFQHPPKFMQQDVSKIIGSKRKKGDLVTDIVMEVHLLDGTKKLLYIHIEVQSTPTYQFGEKMFKPFYRLKDKYNQEVTALALFVGEYLPQNHDHYEYSFGRTVVRYDYPTYIVKGQDKEVLKTSKNPFAVAVLACIYLIETKKSTLYKNRLALKKELADFIIEAIEAQDFDELTSAAIIDFVVNVMILPAKLESVFITHYYEKYFKMDNTDIITGRTIPFADAFTKAFFKDSYTNIIQQLREAKEVKIKAKKEIEEMKAARLKAEKAKLKAEKEAKAAKLKAEIKTENLILKLHLEQKMDSTAIASILEEKETYVKAVLSKAKNKNAKK